VIYPRAVPLRPDPARQGPSGELGTSHIVARQELREMVAGLALPLVRENDQPELAFGHDPLVLIGVAVGCCISCSSL
jgi:chromosome partitioning protein